MREDEYHEAQTIEAYERTRENLECELSWLEYKHKKCLYLDRFHDALDLEAEIYLKKKEIKDIKF